MMLFGLYAVLTPESVDESLLCEHSNETCLAELLNNTIKYFLGFKKLLFCLYVFLSLEEIPFCDLKPLQHHVQYFSVGFLHVQMTFS